MANMDVTPEKLRSVANDVETMKAEYEKAYKAMYDAISTKKSDFVGLTGTEFFTRIEAYRPQFEQIATYVAQYCEFLRRAADGYENWDQQQQAVASTLRIQ